jgi:hypothetical protein
LGERIERNLYDLLETLIRAKYTRERRELLEEANLLLKILRFQMRFAKDLACLDVDACGFAVKVIDEIGILVRADCGAGDRANETLRQSLAQSDLGGRPRPGKC